MGSSNSRVGRMSARGQREESGDSDDTDPDFATILSYLIRSGQVQILSSRSPGGEDEDDAVEEEDDDCYNFSSAAPPHIDFNPDTSAIERSEFKQKVLKESGQCCCRVTRSKPSIPQMLLKREVGVNGTHNFSHGDRCSITTPFLPNVKTTVASYHHKAFCGTYSKDGSVFLSAAQDQNIRVYDTTMGRFELLKCIRARDVGWSVLDTAFSPDGNYMIYSSWSDSVHLCNLHGDHETHMPLTFCPDDGRFCIFSLTFSEDNTEVLGGANDGCLYVYDRDQNQRSLKIDAHDDDVNAVAFADASSQILFSGGDDGLCKVWDRRTLSEASPKPVGVLAGHSDGITYIDSKGDARYLISNSKDQSIKLWDIRVFSPSEGQEATMNAVSSQRWDYRWQRVPRKMNKSKKLPGDTSLMTYRGHCVLHTLIRAHFSPDFTTGQRYIYSGCATGALLIYDVLTGQVVSKLKEHSHCVRDVSWHPYENTIMTASWDGTVGKWEYRTSAAYSDESDNNDSDDEEDHDRSGKRRQSQRLREKQERCRRRSPRLLSRQGNMAPPSQVEFLLPL